MRRASFVLATCFLLGGCAIGKTARGSYVLGVDVSGGSPESAAEGFAAAAAAVPGVVARAAAGDWLGALGAGAGVLTTLAAGVFGVRKASQATAAKEAAARLAGREEGWDQAVGKPAVVGEAQNGGAA